MLKNLSVCIIFLTLFFLPFFIFEIDFSSKSSDWRQHWFYTQPAIKNYEIPSPTYPVLIHYLLKPFNSSFNLFFFTTVVLIVALFSLFILFLFQDWIYIAFFFMLSSFFWTLMVGGHITQAFIGVLFLALFYFKAWWQRVAIAVLSFFIHTNGAYLISFIIIVLLLFKFFNWKMAKFFPSLCSGGSLVENYKSVPEALWTNIFPKPSDTSWLILSNFFLKICPFPVFFAGLKGLWNSNKPFFASGVLLFGWNVFFFGSVRIFESLGLFFMVGFFYWWQKSKADWKLLFIPAALFFFAVNYYSFIIYLLKFKWC